MFKKNNFKSRMPQIGKKTGNGSHLEFLIKT